MNIRPQPSCVQPPRPPIDTRQMDVAYFKKRDADHNGYLSSDEYGVGQYAQDEFRRKDKNHDGALTFQELHARRPAPGHVEGKTFPVSVPPAAYYPWPDVSLGSY